MCDSVSTYCVNITGLKTNRVIEVTPKRKVEKWFHFALLLIRAVRNLRNKAFWGYKKEDSIFPQDIPDPANYKTEGGKGVLI